MYGLCFLLLGLANSADAVITFQDPRDYSERWWWFLYRALVLNGALFLLWLSEAR